MATPSKCVPIKCQLEARTIGELLCRNRKHSTAAVATRPRVDRTIRTMLVALPVSTRVNDSRLEGGCAISPNCREMLGAVKGAGDTTICSSSESGSPGSEYCTCTHAVEGIV